MKYRTIGKTGIKLSEIGLGTWEMSGNVYGTKEDNESIKTIHTAFESGTTFIDTAATYGAGRVECLVGKALKQWRRKKDNIVISTKIMPLCGMWDPPPNKSINFFFPHKHIVNECEKSLKRLGVDQIGILFLHTWSRSWGIEEDWFNALTILKKKGKIRAFGISIPDQDVACSNVHIEAGRVDVIQCVYNIFQQEPEYSLFPLAKKHNIGIIARSPFSSGALIGNWKKNIKFQKGDWRGTRPYLFNKNWLIDQINMVNEVKKVVKNEKVPLNIIALKFILMNKNVTSVIPGSANHQHVLVNIKAAGSKKLHKKIIYKLRSLWISNKVHGTYNGSK